MHRHLLILTALTAFAAAPVSARASSGGNDGKQRTYPCKPTRSDDRSQTPTAKAPTAQAPAQEAPTGGFLLRGWQSFFTRPSTPLLP